MASQAMDSLSLENPQDWFTRMEAAYGKSEIIWTGSRVLTPAESNYSNIEREALALVEAVKYFHRFVAGRHFAIRTDHAPLKIYLQFLSTF